MHLMCSKAAACCQGTVTCHPLPHLQGTAMAELHKNRTGVVKATMQVGSMDAHNNRCSGLQWASQQYHDVVQGHTITSPLAAQHH
jgi:hypothetical protein